jgi:excisionase family DNA binding protein
MSGRPSRLTLTPKEAADALGVSRDFFDAHVKKDLKLIRRGRLVLVPVAELERWIAASAEPVLELTSASRGG